MKLIPTLPAALARSGRPAEAHNLPARGLGLDGFVALDWFEHAPGFVAVLSGPEFIVVHANDAYKRLVGHDELVGLPLVRAVPELEQQKDVLAMLRSVYAHGEAYSERGRGVQLRSPAGAGLNWCYVDFVVHPIPGDDGRSVAGLLVQGCDVTLQMISQRDLQHSLTHDALTGLPNYVLFRDRLERALQAAVRGQRELLVAALDLDLFKRVNACLGHDAGDAVLREIAARISQAAGPDATVARETGDKFLLLVEAERCAVASDLMRSVGDAVAQPVTIGAHTVCVTCCIGAATFPLSGRSASELLMAADRGLAEARLDGAGTLRHERGPTDDRELQRFRLGFALRDALARGGLHLHYQPQVDLISGGICAVEALVRWTTADGTQVAPETLIATAEECGLIGELGDWVLRTACQQVAQWHASGHAGLRLAVNLSARQFAMPGLVAGIMRTLAEVGLAPRFLDLELTESVLMRDVTQGTECLLALKQQGVRVCLDDFGAGYSSLGYLQSLPIDVLKIDRSFMARVPESEAASAIVDAIITMAHSLGMEVIAEGVEHEAQCDFVSRHMCDMVQGFYVSKPVSAGSMTALLRDGSGLPAHLLRFNRRKPTLLLVDDEPSILSSLRRLLRNEGYQVLTAAGGQDGLRVLAEHRVDVIVSDQRMPQMTGVEFLRTVRQLYPDTVRLVLSGFTELQTVTEAVNAGAIYKFLTKPWDDEQLRGHIREAFNYGAMANENRLLTLQVRTANQQLAAANRQLESVLGQQRRAIRQGEISLDIVHEALHYVPVAVLACDEQGTVVLANRAALALFAAQGALLGADVCSLLPELEGRLVPGQAALLDVRPGDDALAARLSPMGNATHSRGWLLTIAPRPLRSGERHVQTEVG